MTRKEILLTQLAEECSEVIQNISKCLRFGTEEVYHKTTLTNAQRVSQEFDDLIGVFKILIEEGVLRFPDEDAIEAKQLKVEEYMKYSLSPNKKEV